MGDLTERERETSIQMYLLVVFLISSAFGMPSKAELDVGSEIAKQLESLDIISVEIGEILNNSNLTKKVVESLQAAETIILEMEVKLKTLQYEVADLRIEDNYFPKHGKAKSHLRETRQKLRELAHRTVAEVRDLKILLEAVNEDSVILGVSIDKMWGMTNETLKGLEEARGNYESALTVFNDLISSVKTQNQKLDKMLTEESDDQQVWEATVTAAVREPCEKRNIKIMEKENIKRMEEENENMKMKMKMENCSTIDATAEIADFEAELKDLKTTTDNILKSGTNFNETIEEAIKILTNKIELISTKTKSAGKVSDNINQYPEESLKKFEAIRMDFIDGLDDLNIAAEQFLKQPVDIV